MATAASRGRALALYRKLLRSSRTWPGPASEKEYILLRHQLEAFNTTAAASNGGIRIAVGFSNVRDDEILRFLKILLYGNSVKEESRTQFRLNQRIADPDEINRKIFEGESRHDIAWHYKIPYPRLHNFPTGSVKDKPSRATRPSYKVPSEEMGSLDDTKPSAYDGGWASLSLRS